MSTESFEISSLETLDIDLQETRLSGKNLKQATERVDSSLDKSILTGSDCLNNLIG